MISLMVAWVAAGLAVGDGPVTDLSILPSDQRTEVVVAVEGSVEYRDFTMEGPYRLVLDLQGASHALPRENFSDIARGGILSVRTSQYSDDVVRIVLELETPLGYVILSDEGYVRISLENPGEPFEPWSAASASPEEGTQRLGIAPPAPSQENDVEVEGEALEIDEARRISVHFASTPIRDVLFTFAEHSNRSIVPGSDVSGSVSAEIRDQPWDIALLAILESHGLAAREMEAGIIRVDNLDNMNQREEVEPLYTRTFRINFAEADEISPSVESLLSDRGRVSVSNSTNTLVVTDIARVLDSVENLIGSLDLRTPQITISAKIVFVNRTDLSQLGVTYDLKDSQGNQLNTVVPGLIDSDGDGLADEQVNQDVIALGGSSIAALGNAHDRIVGPSLSMVSSLVMGRHTLITFLEALETMEMSDVQAAPQVSVQDNHTARILVGERTPIRVVDVGGPTGDFAPPQATVQIEETGIVLEVTPHVTAGDLILMNLSAERSSVDPLPETELGFVFRTQEAETRVLVQDGETVAIGGLTVTEISEVRSGVPLMMNLPVVGRFFRVTREEREQQDLMILVTPHINRN